MASVANVQVYRVYIGEPGAKPTVDDYDPTTTAIEWGVSAGSGLWYAHLVSDLAQQQRRLQDMTLQANATRQVEIWRYNVENETRSDPEFWGEIVGQKLTIVDGEETEVLVARMEPYHFGEPIKGQKVINRDGIEETVNIPLEFNPMVDGKIINNRWKPTGDTEAYWHWIDPESTRTANALKFADFGGPATNEEWDVKSIVQSLSFIANPDETFIGNVPVGDYDAQITDAQPVRNQVLQTGAYLPMYLDAVCHRHGMNWTVDMRLIGDPMAFKPRIRFFSQQSGTEKTLRIQAPGSVMSMPDTNVMSFNLSADSGALANIVTGYGALQEREMTITLYRTWATADDANYSHSEPHIPIGRKWAANEAGDYQDVRLPTFTDPGEPPRFGDAFVSEGWSCKRRVIEDCLTLRDGQRRPPYLEWRATDGDPWESVPNEWGYRVLPDEIGVWFTGQSEDGTEGGIPTELLTDEAELRITGTVRGDKRLEYTTDSSAFSPNSNPVETVVDLSDRFFDRQRQDDGDYASTLTGEADTADDEDALIAHVAKVQAASELIALDATVTLFGHPTWRAYEIGDIITKVEGREISFNRSISDVDAKYVQIVGIKYTNQPGRQSTTLTLSPFGVAS